MLCLAVQTVRAQEPIPASPRRVSGGVLEPDTTTVVRLRGPQSSIFRDSIPISRVAAISLVVPGFAQLYNRDAWKIPVLYGGVGTLGYFAVDANKKFQRYKRQYEFLMSEYYAMDMGPAQTDYLLRTIDPVRTQMVKYNTQRAVYFAGAAATYLYFLADGVVNYPNQTSRVKKATTLAMMFPGAGQLYNKSYWKVPFVVGAFATMGFMVDWNNRVYQRMRTAYNNPTNNEFVNNPGFAWLTREGIKSRRDQARRNRDLCIIATAGVYVLSIIEANVDAYMKDFDVSDDLSMHVEPTLLEVAPTYIAGAPLYNYPGVGMSLKVNF